jgi:hypothetical protein
LWRERRLAVEVSPGAETSPEMVEPEGLLNLVPGQRRYEIAVAARFPSPPPAELHVVPRSTAEALYYLANGVEVPPERGPHASPFPRSFSAAG